MAATGAFEVPEKPIAIVHDNEVPAEALRQRVNVQLVRIVARIAERGDTEPPVSDVAELHAGILRVGMGCGNGQEAQAVVG